jgi:DNA-binding NarL/FixJ family response regulator
MLGFGKDIEVVGIVVSGAAIVDLDVEVEPDVILMDVSLQGLNGIEATRRIVARRPDARVVVLTMHDDADTVAGALDAGAMGFLPKNASRADVLAAVDAAVRGESYLHPSVTPPAATGAGPAHERLTDREREVLELLADGRSTRQIAEQLFVGEETVKTHLGHIYQKLGVTDRVQAVALALRRGLVR